MKTEHRKEAQQVRELKHADAWQDRIEEPSEYEPTDESDGTVENVPVERIRFIDGVQHV